MNGFPPYVPFWKALVTVFVVCPILYAAYIGAVFVVGLLLRLLLSG